MSSGNDVLSPRLTGEESVEESASVCTRVAGTVVVVILELLGELRCRISSSRSSPESLRQVVPSGDEWHHVWR